MSASADHSWTKHQFLKTFLRSLTKPHMQIAQEICGFLWLFESIKIILGEKFATSEQQEQNWSRNKGRVCFFVCVLQCLKKITAYLCSWCKKPVCLEHSREDVWTAVKAETETFPSCK